MQTYKLNWMPECFALTEGGIETRKHGRSIRVCDGDEYAAFAECFAPTRMRTSKIIAKDI
ncbi:MAG: hypothetical protein HC853_02825 [Anaerolineae bacterium]|nr:hypothetical protein [Anaerolineae bacterium]